MIDFIKRLFAKKATRDELYEVRKEILRKVQEQKEQIELDARVQKAATDANFRTLFDNAVKVKRQLDRLETRLGNSFRLVEGKDEVFAEMRQLESVLDGRDASETKELHDKLVRLSYLRAVVRKKDVPEKTYYELIHVIREPASVRIKPTGCTQEDYDIMRELHGL